VIITLLPKSQREKFPPKLITSVQFREPNGNKLLDANERGEIQITIKNEGRGNAWNVQTRLALTNPHNLRGLMPFEGAHTIRQLAPGASEIIRIPMAAGMDLPSTQLEFNFAAEEANGFDAAPLKITFGTQAFITPNLAMTDVGINDAEAENSSGNGDSKIQPNETIEATVVIQNRGQGKAKDVKAVVKVADQNIYYHGESVYNFGDLEAGDYRVIKFPFVVNNRYVGSSLLPIALEVTESWGKYGFSKSLGLELNKTTLAAKEITITGKQHIPTEIPEAPVLAIDIDSDIPKSKNRQPDAIAVILGIERYRNIANVTYARRDAAVFKEYAVKVLGVPDDENHLYFRTDDEVTQAVFYKLFTANGWLAKRVQPASEVYIYYAGHGAPELEKKLPYLLPFDGDADYPIQTGFGLDSLYKELAKLNARSVTVFLDACFSGGTREKEVLLAEMRGVTLTPRNPDVPSEKMVVFAAASGNQISSAYPEMKHGLFTYFLLKGLRGEADKNQDKEIAVDELEVYLVTNVEKTAGQLDREQTPQVMGWDKRRVLVKY
jgi:hypothetical protein